MEEPVHAGQGEDEEDDVGDGVPELLVDVADAAEDGCAGAGEHVDLHGDVEDGEKDDGGVELLDRHGAAVTFLPSQTVMMAVGSMAIRLQK